MRANVIRFPTSEPGDTRFLGSLISSQQIDPRDIVALLCKTEGTGTPSDFSRELASERYSRNVDFAGTRFGEKSCFEPGAIGTRHASLPG